MRLRKMTCIALAAFLLLATCQGFAQEATPAAGNPRISRLQTPQGLGEGQPLEGEGIPSSYILGASLALTGRGAVCVSPLDPWMIVECATGWSWYDNAVWDNEWEDYEDTPPYYLIVDGDDWAYLISGAGFGGEEEDVGVRFFGEDYMETMWLGVPDEPRVSADRAPYAGPILRMADSGRLLFSGPTGTLYTCEMDGGDVQEIEGVAATEFVYHDGAIYFANLNDVKTYADVPFVSCVSDDENEMLDLSYPRLYRVNLDGTGLEKLTECGVRGLVSQGPHIVYQNLDDGFTLPFSDMDWPRILFGALYGFDAEKGGHAPLSIDSDLYFATPYGLAVWYHDASFEPHDLERAELVLHAYDGTPLYRLDAGPAEYLGSYGVGEGAAVFYSVTDWWTGEQQFTTVPLDGSAKWEGTPGGFVDSETVSIQIGDETMAVPLNVDELDLAYCMLGDEGIEPLAGLTALTWLDLSDNDITDLTPLSGLVTLESLDLWLNYVTDLTPLAGLPRLKSLGVSNNIGLRDFSPLLEMPALRYLEVADICLESLEPFSALTGLTYLDIRNCEIDALSPIAGLTALTCLDASYNFDLSDITPIAKLTLLDTLYLDHAQVSDLTPLAGMVNLQTLSLRDCLVSDLSPLYALTALEWVDLSENDALTLEEIALLKVNLPDVKIVSDYRE